MSRSRSIAPQCSLQPLACPTDFPLDPFGLTDLDSINQFNQHRLHLPHLKCHMKTHHPPMQRLLFLLSLCTFAFSPDALFNQLSSTSVRSKTGHPPRLCSASLDLYVPAQLTCTLNSATPMRKLTRAYITPLPSLLSLSRLAHSSLSSLRLRYEDSSAVSPVQCLLLSRILTSSVAYTLPAFLPFSLPHPAQPSTVWSTTPITILVIRLYSVFSHICWLCT